MKGLLLIGGGGHCKAAIEVIEAVGLKIAGVLEVAESPVTEVLGHPVLGRDSDLPALIAEGHSVLVTIGQIKSPAARKRAFEMALGFGAEMPRVISPAACVSKYAALGVGTLVMHCAVINAAARVGRNVIVNSQALLEHDVEVGDHCHIATGARVNGSVTIGRGSFVGSGAVIKEGTRVGENVIIGAGQIVLRDVPDGMVITDVY